MSGIGRRIQVVGPSGSGKSTLGEQLARRIGAPFVELDALFWKPGWQEPEPDEFLEKVRAATSGDSWVVAGNYLSRVRPVVWPRVETVVWLDFPNRVLFPRIIRRSWQRSRRREFLWGTNYERFWPQLKVWSMDSLIGYSLRRGHITRERILAGMEDPALRHITWVRLRSPKEASRWLAGVFDLPAG